MIAKVGVDDNALQRQPGCLASVSAGPAKAARVQLGATDRSPAATRDTLHSRSIYAASRRRRWLAVAWCGLNLYQMIGARGRGASKLRDRTRQEQSALSGTHAQLPALAGAVRQLQLTVDVAERIGALARLPDTMFRIVSSALG